MPGWCRGFVLDDAYQARRGSQEPLPPLGERAGLAKDWEDFDTAVRLARPALRSLRQLMKEPPPDMGCDIVEALRDGSLPNYVIVRRGAQALQAAVINDLHHGDLAEALEDLEALLAFGRLYAQDPTLVGYMIRVAVTGLSSDICWDALQDRVMNGKPLRYRLNTDGSFTLYSGGEDARDDGGDPLPKTVTQGWQRQYPWAGRDWVWPRTVAVKAQGT